MSTQLIPKRGERSTEFLASEEEWSCRVDLGQSRYGVTHYTDSCTDKVIFSVGTRSFSLHEHLSAEEARILGSALLMAADEIDALESE